MNELTRLQRDRLRAEEKKMRVLAIVSPEGASATSHGRQPVVGCVLVPEGHSKIARQFIGGSP